MTLHSDAAKWRRFFELTNTPFEPLPHGALLIKSKGRWVFLADAFDLHRRGISYQLEQQDALSREMQLPVIMPNQFPIFHDRYDHDADDISRYGMWLSCAFMEVLTKDFDESASLGWDGTMGMAWADSYQNTFAVDDDRIGGPVYPCAFGHLSLKQDRQDGSYYRHGIPFEAYMKAAIPDNVVWL